MKPTSSLESRLKILHKIGLKQFNQEQLLPALNTFQKVLAIAQETESLEYHVEALHRIGMILYSLQQYSASLHFFKQIIKRASAKSKSVRVARVYNDIARVYCATQHYSEALRYSAQALEIFIQISNIKGVGMTLNYLGEIYNHLGLHEQALQCSQKALMIFQDIQEIEGEENLNHSISEATALYNIGLAEYHLSRPYLALAFLNQALTIRQKICSSDLEDFPKKSEKLLKFDSELAKTLGQIGIVYFSLKNYKNARYFYQKAVKIYQKNHQQQEQAKLMNYIGIACYKQNHISQSLWYHLKALELFETLKDPQHQENTLPHILSVYQRFKLSDEGVTLYQQVQKLFQKMGTEVS